MIESMEVIIAGRPLAADDRLPDAGTLPKLKPMMPTHSRK